MWWLTVAHLVFELKTLAMTDDDVDMLDASLGRARPQTCQDIRQMGVWRDVKKLQDRLKLSTQLLQQLNLQKTCQRLCHMVFEVVWVAMCCLGRQVLMELFQKLGDPKLGRLLQNVDDILTARDLTEQAGKHSRFKPSQEFHLKLKNIRWNTCLVEACEKKVVCQLSRKMSKLSVSTKSALSYLRRLGPLKIEDLGAC